MSDLQVGIIVIILSVAIWLVLPNLLTKRAMRKVIQTFRSNNITSAQNAKSPAELGLKPRSVLESLFSLRDYKPAALKLLMQADVIRETKDGRLYLSKEKLGLYEIGKEKS